MANIENWKTNVIFRPNLSITNNVANIPVKEYILFKMKVHVYL